MSENKAYYDFISKFKAFLEKENVTLEEPMHWDEEWEFVGAFGSISIEELNYELRK